MAFKLFFLTYVSIVIAIDLNNDIGEINVFDRTGNISERMNINEVRKFKLKTV